MEQAFRYKVGTCVAVREPGVSGLYQAWIVSRQHDDDGAAIYGVELGNGWYSCIPQEWIRYAVATDTPRKATR